VSRLQRESAAARADKETAEARLAELAASVSFLRSELEAERRQHEGYKAKAKKVLAEKDKLIASLREGSGPDSPLADEAEMNQLL